jgi:hypothetical protein
MRYVMRYERGSNVSNKKCLEAPEITGEPAFHKSTGKLKDYKTLFI